MPSCPKENFLSCLYLIISNPYQFSLEKIPPSPLLVRRLQVVISLYRFYTLSPACSSLPLSCFLFLSLPTAPPPCSVTVTTSLLFCAPPDFWPLKLLLTYPNRVLCGGNCEQGRDATCPRWAYSLVRMTGLMHLLEWQLGGEPQMRERLENPERGECQVKSGARSSYTQL